MSGTSDAFWKGAAACRLPKGLYSRPVTSEWWSITATPDLANRQLDALRRRRDDGQKVLLHFGPLGAAIDEKKLQLMFAHVDGLHIQSFSEHLRNLHGGLPRIEVLSVGALEENHDLNLDLGRFPAIRSISGHAKHYTGINCARNLEEISLRVSKSSQLPTFRGHRKLRRFEVIASPMSKLGELELPESLESLALWGCSRLEDIADLARMVKLLELKIESCRQLKSASSVGECRSLVYLLFSNIGPIPDVAFAENLRNLEFFSFMDVNVLDGNVSRLRLLKKLKFAAFDNKRHYDARMEDVAPGPFIV